MWPNIEPRMACGTLVAHHDGGALGQVIGWDGYDDDVEVRWIVDESISLVPAMDLIPVFDSPSTTCARQRHGPC